MAKSFIYKISYIDSWDEEGKETFYHENQAKGCLEALKGDSFVTEIVYEIFEQTGEKEFTVVSKEIIRGAE